MPSCYTNEYNWSNTIYTGLLLGILLYCMKSFFIRHYNLLRLITSVLTAQDNSKVYENLEKALEPPILHLKSSFFYPLPLQGLYLRPNPAGLSST